MITCYDNWSAKIIAESDMDCVLVGDSLAMVMYGENSTVNVSVDTMAMHISAVAKSVGNKFIIGDMPFLSYRKSLTENMNAIEKVMKAGAHAIKLEGAAGNIEIVEHVVQSGIPVMGHLGLTPQFIHQLGGFKVQGKTEDSASAIVSGAKQLEQAGCFSLVLEAVPNRVSEVIGKELSIPTIGIGAGPSTDGQVLVLHDMLGVDNEFKPKFLKKYLEGHSLILGALNEYNKEVKQGDFPSINESYE